MSDVIEGVEVEGRYLDTLDHIDTLGYLGCPNPSATSSCPR